MSDFFPEGSQPERDGLRQLMTSLEAADRGKLQLQFPSIAVMGDTSSGKSSLLSALCGLQFPSAAGICTRCPIRVQMKANHSLDANHFKIYVSSTSGKEFTTVSTEDDAEATKAIAAAQNVLCSGTDSRICKHPVEVEVQGPGQPELTVIDLPGIVRSVGADESDDLIGDVNSLLDTYLENERCVILGVHQADLDFHNSEILDRAKRVDPNHDRTIPVLTKADRVEKGAESEVIQLLHGDKVHCRRGFHMVRCMTQQEVDKKMTLKKFASFEKRFLEELPGKWAKAGKVDMDLVGFPKLRAKLSGIYFEIMYKSLPGIVKDIVDLKARLEQELDAMGPVLDHAAEKRRYYDGIIDQLETFFHQGWKAMESNSQDGFLERAVIENAKTDFAASLLNSSFCRMDEVSADGNFVAKNGERMQLPHNQKDLGSLDSQTAENLSEEDLVPDHVGYLSKRLEQRRDATLVIFLGRDVFEEEVRRHVDGEWKALCEVFGRQVVAAFSHVITHSFAVLDANCQVPGCSGVVKGHLVKLNDTFSANVSTHLLDQLRRESIPETHNHYLTEIITKKRGEDQIAKLAPHTYSSGNDGSPSISFATVKSVIRETTGASLMEAVARDLEIALDAYSKVAAKRLGDNLPIAIERHVLIPALSTAVEGLKSKTDEELSKMLRVDPITTRRHATLVEKIKCCNEALAAVDDFCPGAAYTCASFPSSPTPS